MSGGIRHHWLKDWIRLAGTKRWGTIWGNRPDGMPAFPLSSRTRRGVSAPAFLLGQRKDRTEFDLAGTRAGLVHRLDRPLPGHPARRGRRLRAPAARRCSLTRACSAVRVAGDGVTRVYGLQPGHVRVRLLDDNEVRRRDARLRHLPLGAGRSAGATAPTGRASPAPATRCTGTLDRPRGTPAARPTTTTATCTPGRCPTRSSPPSTSARCPAPSASRSSAPSATAPGTTTPTCCPARPPWNSASTSATCPPSSWPRCRSRPANYVQRAGRAGRRTGQRVPRHVRRPARPREQYYFAEPRQMIAGEIVPPGCYLSAIEILRRQYVAHLADLAARGQLPGVLPMPRRASALFGESGWLRRLVAAATGDADQRRPARRAASSPCSPATSTTPPATNCATFARTGHQGQGRRGGRHLEPPPRRPARPPRRPSTGRWAS